MLNLKRQTLSSPLTTLSDGEAQLIAQLNLLEKASCHDKEIREKLFKTGSLIDELMKDFEGSSLNAISQLKDIKGQSPQESIDRLDDSTLRLKKLEVITTFVKDVEEIGSLSEAHKKADELKKRALSLSQAVKEVYKGIDELRKIKETLQRVVELKKENIIKLTEV